MAAPPVFAVDGGRQLRRTLKEAGVSLKELKAVHALAARVAKTAIESRVPVRSGRLLATLRSAGTNAAAVIRAGYASVPYGGPIHWGWSKRHIKANPFMTIGARASEPRWVGIYDDYVKQTLDRIEGA